MLTLNVVIQVTVLFCFQSVDAFVELAANITAAIDALQNVTGQIVAYNETELQKFGDILEYFVDRTQLERDIREEVHRQTNSNATQDEDDEKQDLTEILPWETAVNEAFYEENITTVNNTLQDQVIQFLNNYVFKPENISQAEEEESRKYIRDYYDEDTSASEDGDQTQSNPFWESEGDTRRIYRGKRTKIKVYPFVVSVLIFRVFACAGAIIQDDLVITAASCLQLAHNNRFFRENPAFLSVRVGSHYFSVGGEVVPVNEVYFHPTYDPKTLHDNLAIMRLTYVLNLGSSRSVKKIDFDRNGEALPENTPGITIIGWGAKGKPNKIVMNQLLQTARLDFYDKVSCRNIYGKKFVTRTNFCAGFISKGSGACNRDVGDPGVVGRYLTGVTSFGSPICGKPDTPTVFTKLGFYTDWIEEIMEQEIAPVKMRTTTKVPFHLTFDQKFRLFEMPEDVGPIPVLRQPKEEILKLDQDINNLPVDYEKDLGLQQDSNNAIDKEEVQEFEMDHVTELIKKTVTVQNKEIDPNEEADPEVQVKGTGRPLPFPGSFEDNRQSDKTDENDAVREGPQGENAEINYGFEQDDDYVELATAKVDLDWIQENTDDAIQTGLGHTKTDTDTENIMTPIPETIEDIDDSLLEKNMTPKPETIDDSPLEKLMTPTPEIIDDIDDSPLEKNMTPKPETIDDSPLEKNMTPNPETIDDSPLEKNMTPNPETINDSPLEKNMTPKPETIENFDDSPLEKIMTPKPETIEDINDSPLEKNMTPKPETIEEIDDSPLIERPMKVTAKVHSEGLSDMVEDVVPHMDANTEGTFANYSGKENKFDKSEKHDNSDRGSKNDQLLAIKDLNVTSPKHTKNKTKSKRRKKRKKSRKIHPGLGDPKMFNRHDESVPESAFKEKETQLDQPQIELSNDITEEMVKLEIQKLLDQLDNTNELIDEQQHTNNSNNTPLRNLVLNMDTEEGKTADTVLTFLYLSDTEKKPHLRATETSEEGLSIDAEAFKRNMLHKNDSIALGKSEIYGIFDDVMNIVNKTYE